MKLKLTFIFLIGFCLTFISRAICFAALDSNIVTLPMINLKIPDNRFYIKDVIDGRQDKSNIGNGMIGFFNSRKPVYLADDLGKSVKSLSVGTYENILLGSELNPWDIGVKASIGIQF